ncbi:MAG: cupredoxin domain-containing protein [Euryarchaeota archaeon]
MKKYTLFVLAASVVLTVLIAGCTSSSNPSPSAFTSFTSSASQNTVVIKDYAVTPSTLTIQKGANVTWKNNDSVDHELFSDSPVFSFPKIGVGGSSPLIHAGGTYTYQFNTTGTYPYHCYIHMQETGTILVQ